MEQLALFDDAGQSKGLPEEYLAYVPGLFTAAEGDHFLATFIRTIAWQQRKQVIYDKEVITPRLIARFGEPGTAYSESGKISDPAPWTPELQQIRERIEPLVGVRFNSVLLNYYRDGNDSVAWHSDKENILGRRPVIASVTFGQVRSFDIRNKADHSEKYSVKLEHGSFLLMKAGLQERWEHRITKSSKPMKARINLTFRVVI